MIQAAMMSEQPTKVKKAPKLMYQTPEQKEAVSAPATSTQPQHTDEMLFPA